MSSNQPSLAINEVFKDRYKISTLVGQGGMGAVYLADDLRLKGKQWAIKEIMMNQDKHKQFIDEAKVLVKLNHPFLPNIIDYYPPDKQGHSYLVMDYIRGNTLQQVFNDGQKNLPLSGIIRYVFQLCELFDYLHNQLSNPIVYRDIKPANIIIDENDNVRLIDFGIARNYKKGKKSDTVQMGTMGFAAPEQFENKQTDHRTDIYSLGALFFFLLSRGDYYYHGQKRITLFRQDIHPKLEEILTKMLMNNPNERYQNIVEVKNDLDLVLNIMENAHTEKLTTILTEPNKRNFNGESINQLFKQDNEDNNIPMDKKVIVVANLSKRAGSTFLSVNLAKYFSESNILTSLIDLPFEPYIFDYIGLDNRLNGGYQNDLDDYYSYHHAIHDEVRIERGKEVIDDGIIWMVTDPRKPLISGESWNYQHMMKLLYSSKKADIKIVDLGSENIEQSINVLADQADIFLIVVDPMPSELIINAEKLENLIKRRNNGEPIEFVINKWTNGVNSKEFIDAFKIKPISYIPCVELVFIHKAVYDCKIPYSIEEIKNKLIDPFFDIGRLLVPSYMLIRTSQEEVKSKSFISKLIRKGS